MVKDGHVKFSTDAIHSGYSSDPTTGATAVPVYQTAAYAYDSAKELADVFKGRAPGHVYTRITNPTNMALEQRLAKLEGGVGALVTASGMAAISSVLTGLLKSGDHLISTTGIFGGTTSYLKNVLGRFGVTVDFVAANDLDAFRAALTPATRLLFVETITNPSMDVPDLSALSALAQEQNIPLVVDATATPPSMVKTKEFGASVVIHSTTKFINGHGTAIGGVLIDTGNYNWRESPFEDLATLAKRAGPMAFLAHQRNLILRDLGGCAAPENSFLMLQGLKTLKARMAMHCDNARRLAEFLSERPEVAWVNYPGLKSSPYYETVQKQFGGQAGAILTFGVRGDAFACLDRFKLAQRMTNLGDARTLVLHPASTIFAEYTPEEREAQCVGDDMIRVAVGIEDFEDICEDFEQAIGRTE